MRITDYLADPDMRAMTLDALAAGAGVVVMCSLLSPLVVVKRLGFVGQGVSHAAFGGIGVAAILGALGLITPGSPMEVAVVAAFCILSAVVIAGLSNRRAVPEDTAIGIVLVGSMALGAILVQADFEALNGFGAMIPQRARCVIAVGGEVSVSITAR